MSNNQKLADIEHELEEQGERLRAIEQSVRIANDSRFLQGQIVELHLANITYCLSTLIEHFCGEDDLGADGYRIKRKWYEDQLSHLRDKEADLRGIWRGISGGDVSS